MMRLKKIPCSHGVLLRALRACSRPTSLASSLSGTAQVGSKTDSSGNSEELCGEGVVVGCYESNEGGSTAFELTECAKDLDLKTQGKLIHLINMSGGKISKGDARLFYDLSPEHSHVAVVGVGPSDPEALAKEGEREDIDVASQNIRIAAAAGTKLLQKAKVKNIYLDDFNNAEACAEGSTLSLFSYDKLKSSKKKDKIPSINLISSSPPHLKQWYRGHVLASAQNFARELMESPSNHMTPTMFVEAVNGRIGEIRQRLGSSLTLQSIPRPLSWIESQKMGAFLGVARGSAEVPWLLELRLNMGEGETADDGRKPIVLVGKGTDKLAIFFVCSLQSANKRRK